MPVGPEDAVGLDVQVHGVDAHIGVTLEGLFVHPVGHAWVQTADFVVVGDVEHLPVAVQTWQRDTEAENVTGGQMRFFFWAFLEVLWKAQRC